MARPNYALYIVVGKENNLGCNSGYLQGVLRDINESVTRFSCL